MSNSVPRSVLEAAQQLNFRDTMLLAITSAISFTIALYWKDVIQMIVRRLFPQKADILGNVAAALFVTLAGVLAIYVLVIASRPQLHIDNLFERFDR